MALVVQKVGHIAQKTFLSPSVRVAIQNGNSTIRRVGERLTHVAPLRTVTSRFKSDSAVESTIVSKGSPRPVVGNFLSTVSNGLSPKEVRSKQFSDITNLTFNEPSDVVHKTVNLTVYEADNNYVVDIGPMGAMSRGLMNDLIRLPAVLDALDSDQKGVLVMSIGDKPRLEGPFGSGGDLKEVYMHTLQQPESEERVKEWVDLTHSVKKAIWSGDRPWGTVLLPNQKIFGLTHEVFAGVPMIYSEGSSVCCPQLLHGIPNSTMEATEISLSRDGEPFLTANPEAHSLDTYSDKVYTAIPASDFQVESLGLYWGATRELRQQALDSLEQIQSDAKADYVFKFSNNASSIQRHIERVVKPAPLNKALKNFSKDQKMVSESISSFLRQPD